MKTQKRIVGCLSALMALLVFASGCGSKEPISTTAQPAPAVQHNHDQEVRQASPSDSVPEEKPAPPATTPAPPESSGDKVSLASSEAPQEPADAPPSKPKIEIKEPYTQEKPTLLGLALKTKADDIVGQFGKPADQFLMEEEEPITVYDYTDFLVGFNSAKELQFIDVRSKDVDPGLNGLKLGDKVADAVKALGQPDTNTSYVIAYESEGALLKLDVDPKTQVINSIKLFAE